MTTRRKADFDAYCDPQNPVTLDIKDVLTAADRLRCHVIYTPCKPSNIQRSFLMGLHFKLESLQKTGSFKERGARNVLAQLPEDKRKRGVIIASLGNEALAMCQHASELEIPLTTIMPVIVPIALQQRCLNLGARVFVQGNNLMESQRHARAMARDTGLTYINSRDHPDVLAGYGTIGLEILEQMPKVKAVIVPVGYGGLASAVATTIKAIKPKCLVYGVQSETMPAFFKSLENAEPMKVPTEQSLAYSTAVNRVGVNSLFTALPLLDKMLLVNDDWIARAMLHLVEKERLVVEADGACALAAIIGGLVPELKRKNVVCVLTGGNVDNYVFARCLERGLAAEGRLMKFRVRVRDTSFGQTQLFKLLESGGYNVVEQFQEHRWIGDEPNHGHMEITVVCSTRCLEHALELKSLVERAYPFDVVFENNPYNDKRSCTCYIRSRLLDVEKTEPLYGAGRR